MNGTSPSDCVLADAVKSDISMRGQALLQWGFGGGFPDHSVQMPEAVIDQILAWRDAAAQNAANQARSKVE